MMRKYLFWGLTLVLLTALINLIIRGRRLEKRQASQLVEVIQESKPTATRVLTPHDLEIVNSKIQLKEESGVKGKFLLDRHEIEIHNNGDVPYSTIQLSFEYLDRGGRVLATRAYGVTQTLLPGTDLKLSDIQIEGLPSAATSCRTAIVYADIGPAHPLLKK